MVLPSDLEELVMILIVDIKGLITLLIKHRHDIHMGQLASNVGR